MPRIGLPILESSYSWGRADEILAERYGRCTLFVAAHG